ncbi:MAG: amino acid adenylation domain-containing protein [Actinomycetota bacterium]|nr:amino acid adenylation domain-containing protein [Actinomycetota bacterium]
MSDKIDENFQVSPQQERLWLAAPEGPDGRVQATVSLVGSIDAAGLRQALGLAVARHEILRTTFVRQPGILVPLQVVGDELEPAWETVDIAALPAPERAERVAEVCAAELRMPLDFAAGPLLRAVLITHGEDAATLVLTVSSLCADAASAGLLVREIAHHLTGQGSVAEEPLQYADFAAWQVELQGAEDVEAMAAREYWSGMAGVSSPTLPFTTSGSGLPLATEHVPLAADLASTLNEGAKDFGVSVDTLVHAAWCLVIARSTATETPTLTFVGSARRHADLGGAIGALSGSVPLSTELPAEGTFAEVLQSLDAARAAAPVWQDYAPAEAGAAVSIGFVSADGVHVTDAELSLRLERVIDTGRGLGLALTCCSGEGDPRLELSFDPAWHDRQDVQRLARRLEHALQVLAADPGIAVVDLDILDESERRRLLVEFNPSSAPVPAGAAHELFARAAAQSPTRTATIDEHGSLTYAELEARANQLAHHLRAAGVIPGVAVGLYTERDNEMLVGLLGILKAGGAYLPLHHEHPPARLGQQLETAGATVIVSQEPLLGHLPEFAGRIILLDRDRAALDGEPETAPEITVGGDELAYVIYTSGSTGTPKGVGVTHANLVNYATFIAGALGADREPLSFGLVTSISTDLGNTSVFGALCSGGTLVLLSPAAVADGAALARELERAPVDVLKITPSHVGALLAGGDARVLPRRWLVLGGERAPWDLIARVRKISQVPILNHYGPTEATIGCCTFPVGDGPGPFAPATVPIGRPIANSSCYVVDDRLRPVPLGVPGRLFIGGAGIARGYVGQPELTAERFGPDPFAEQPEARMYETGDLARWLPDGTLEFLGRDDEQIKVRGYRVEPAEVEAALRSHPAVSDAVIVTQAGASGDLRLVAYCATTGAVSPDELRSHLANWLPEFMIPPVIATLDVLPRTPSGKVDRRSLPDPATLTGQAASAHVAPRTPIEEAVAAMWAQTLGLERVGVTEDFFEIGGHSLVATQVVAQVRSGLAVDLPLHSLFTCPTVESLAAEIMRMMGESEQDETAELLAELEGLSDEDAERLLAGEGNLPEPG